MKMNYNKTILPGTFPKMSVAQTGISVSNTQQPVSLWKRSFQQHIEFPFPFLSGWKLIRSLGNRPTNPKPRNADVLHWQLKPQKEMSR